MIIINGKKYREIKYGTNPLDVNINGITVVNNAVTDINLTLIDQNGDDVPFTQTGTELEVNVGSTTGEWIRPIDWLPIPSIATSEEVFYGLCMIYEDRANLVSLRFTGNYTVDWGDGVIENFASNVVAHHQYSWASVGNATSEGFRQALIKVTPQVGHNLSGINLQFKHPLMGSGNLRSSIFIDMVMNLPQLASGASIILGGLVNIRHSFTERVNILSIGNATSLQALCVNFIKLQKFEIGDTIGVTNTIGMFQVCTSLKEVPLFNTVNVTNTIQMFLSCVSLETVPLFNTTNVQNMTAMFQNCYILQAIPLFNTTNVQNMTQLFQNCFSVRKVNFNISTINTALTNTFNLTENIYSLILSGCRYGFNVSNNEMSATALNDLFTSLSTAVGSQTITITGNPGASTCNPSIATSKGFTVVL